MAASSNTRKLTIGGVITIIGVEVFFGLARHSNTFPHLQIALDFIAVVVIGFVFYRVRKADNARLEAFKASLANRPPISDTGE